MRGDDQIGADGPQFAVDLVADVGGYGNHCCRHGHAQRDGGSRQQFAPLLAPERFVYEPDEHRLLLCEHATPGRNVRLLNDHGIGGLRCLKRHRIASPGRPY